MTGNSQVRFVAGVFILFAVLGIGSGLLKLLSAQEMAMGTTYSGPIQVAFSAGYGWIALLLLRGSNKARIALSIVSMFFGTVLLLLGVMFIASSSIDKPNISWLYLVLIAIICFFCCYVLIFSKSMKDELARRRDAAAKKELLERRKYYESVGEKFEE